MNRVIDIKLDIKEVDKHFLNIIIILNMSINIDLLSLFN